MTNNRGHRNRDSKRAGVALVLLVVCLVTLMTFVALAIDLGMLAVARTQAQDAADAAAMAGARALNGSTATNNNYSNAGPAAIAAATGNGILGSNVQTSQVSINIGRYSYVSANQRFEGQFPGPSTENWSMVNATINSNVGSKLAFSKVFNFTGANIQATATAAHRPRDVAIVLDFSGSMRYASLMGTPTSGDRSSNSNDSVFPTWGHYSATSTADLQATSFTAPFEAANITATTSDGRAPIVNDFYTSSTGGLAFSAAPTSYGTTPAGDKFLKKNKNAGTAWCTTAGDLLNYTTPGNSTRDSTFESQGYTAYGMAPSFSGYTQGPGYWGKTFFIWPPDPTNDWRSKYFGTTDNSRLYDSSGNWKEPGSTAYTINYTAILNFIKNTGPNPFPSRLQSGRILYYDSIPNSISTSSFPPSDMNQRFWKDYIDFVLGLIQQSSSNWDVILDGSNGYAGYGTDYTFGTVKVTATSTLTGSPKPYMHYLDNPLRPRTHFWFGPMTMVDFLGCYNLWSRVSPASSRFCWWPGTCHESPMYGCKLGIRPALTDISNNHPNDLVALTMFSTPCESANDGGRFNRVRVGLSRNYSNMQESLWYPPTTIGNSSATVRPYDANNLEVPRAMGSTCYSMPLMQMYNQFSANTSLLNYNPGAPAGDAGGGGRKGAQKILIFETDGAPNATASASFVNSGAYNSYYAIRYNSSSPSSSDFPNVTTGYSDNNATVVTEINNICTRICPLDTASPPGYSTPSKKVQIHCIGFGPQFSPSSSGSTASIATLNGMQTIGNVSDGMPDYKTVYGDESTVVTNLQQAFTQILQSGVQVSLIQ